MRIETGMPPGLLLGPLGTHVQIMVWFSENKIQSKHNQGWAVVPGQYQDSGPGPADPWDLSLSAKKSREFRIIRLLL